MERPDKHWVCMQWQPWCRAFPIRFPHFLSNRKADSSQIHKPFAGLDITMCVLVGHIEIFGAIQELRISYSRHLEISGLKVVSNWESSYSAWLDEGDGEGWWTTRSSMGSPSALRGKELPTTSRFNSCTCLNCLRSLLLGLCIIQEPSSH